MKSIKKSLKKPLLALLIAVGVTTTAGASAYNEALLTLRFNTGRQVAYQDQLFYVVREAVRLKPTVIFDVVATSPVGHSIQGQRVASDIIKIGVNPQQIMYRTEQNPAARSEEVRIFVR